MGVSGSTNSDLFHDWAKLPISREQWAYESAQQMRLNFSNCMPMPGAEQLVHNLSRAHSVASGQKIELALATGAKSQSYEVKTSRPETKRLIDFFLPERRILGDDPRIPKGCGKPAPDIYLVALQVLNSAVRPDEKAILPSECLVFEDSLAGFEAARRAGMKVVWVPHPDLLAEYQERQTEALANKTGVLQTGHEWRFERMDNDWEEKILTLENFDYEGYGIDVSV
ncbi:hypothetical protein MGYG_04001 [Nannizzia gypsea CBS 118893]|uniref:HAD superfamily hydrolase n=1 Tax=Arthroderma gypseum (strain ATCC MYA-4604 / CBS 118893) TaxID=535722 RepID=E4UUN2_ARTGP|nr:hypothetical protein MGYG_04001 [Nannizzia gypsea CBS 118893]EFR00999.1 hypothetical protein MGYG_04001 [Nannizzia gypsea CBS 118893]